MTDIQLYTKLSMLPVNLKMEVEDFIEFLINKSHKKPEKRKQRIAGKAKGLIKMKSNFDAPLEGFNEYM